jgi:hypothetical protein
VGQLNKIKHLANICFRRRIKKVGGLIIIEDFKRKFLNSGEQKGRGDNERNS